MVRAFVFTYLLRITIVTNIVVRETFASVLNGRLDDVPLKNIHNKRCSTWKLSFVSSKMALVTILFLFSLSIVANVSSHSVFHEKKKKCERSLICHHWINWLNLFLFQCNPVEINKLYAEIYMCIRAVHREMNMESDVDAIVIMDEIYSAFQKSGKINLHKHSGPADQHNPTEFATHFRFIQYNNKRLLALGLPYDTSMGILVTVLGLFPSSKIGNMGGPVPVISTRTVPIDIPQLETNKLWNANINIVCGRYGTIIYINNTVTISLLYRLAWIKRN